MFKYSVLDASLARAKINRQILDDGLRSQIVECLWLVDLPIFFVFIVSADRSQASDSKSVLMV